MSADSRTGFRPVQPVLALLLIFCAVTAPAQTPVGAGSYATTLPPDGTDPMNDLDIPVSPVITAEVTGLIPTTDWWTPLVFKYRSDNPYSDVLAAQPLNLKARPSGCRLGASVWLSQPYAVDLPVLLLQESGGILRPIPCFELFPECFHGLLRRLVME